MEPSIQVSNQQNSQHPETQTAILRTPLLIKILSIYFLWPIWLGLIVFSLNFTKSDFWNPEAIPLIPFALIFIALDIYASVMLWKLKKIGWIIAIILSVLHFFSITGAIALLILLSYKDLYLKKKNA